MSLLSHKTLFSIIILGSFKHNDKQKIEKIMFTTLNAIEIFNVKCFEFINGIILFRKIIRLAHKGKNNSAPILLAIEFEIFSKIAIFLLP